MWQVLQRSIEVLVYPMLPLVHAVALRRSRARPICVRARVRVRVCVCVCVFVCVRVCMCACVRVCVCVRVRAPVHTDMLCGMTKWWCQHIQSVHSTSERLAVVRAVVVLVGVGGGVGVRSLDGVV
jgi:hypothetical protein